MAGSWLLAVLGALDNAFPDNFTTPSPLTNSTPFYLPTRQPFSPEKMLPRPDPRSETSTRHLTPFLRCKSKIPEEYVSHFKDESILNQIPKEYCGSLPRECQILMAQCKVKNVEEPGQSNKPVVISPARNLTIFDIMLALKKNPDMGKELFSLMQRELRKEKSKKSATHFETLTALDPGEERLAALTICTIFLPTLCVLSLLAFALVFWQKRYVMSRKMIVV